MRTVLVTAANYQPLEIAYVKARPELRVTGSTDDVVIADHIKAAIEAYEEESNNILRSSTWDLYLDAFPDEIKTPGPLVSVTSITYIDTAGVTQTLATSYYKVDTTNPLYGRITLKYGQSWPSTYDEINTVTVRFVAGYATADNIPQRVKDGLILKIQELYDGQDRREAYEACWAMNRRIPI